MNFTDNLIALLNKIAATSGRKDKLQLLKELDSQSQRVVALALDPTKTYYIAKLEPQTRSGDIEFGEREFQLLADLSSRAITGQEALDAVQACMATLTPNSAEALRRVILKDLRCGVGAGLVNSAFPGLVPEFPYMRCSLPKDSDIENWDWAFGVYVQLKCDGMFARVAVDDQGSVLITTRQGNTFPPKAIAALAEEAAWTFNKGSETHGELTVWINGELQPRTIGNGLLNSVMQGGEIPEGTTIRFDCWDQIPLAKAVVKGEYIVPYSERLTYLQSQIEESAPRTIDLVESRIVHSKEEALGVYRSYIKQGLEGVIVKHPDGKWKDHTSPHQVKFKLEVDVDLKIVGFNPGEPGKRTEHTFGSLKCASLDGALEVDVAGFKREVELYLHENRDSALGKIVCVRANDISHPCETNPKYSLFHPRFVELRQDKAEPDTTEKVLAQFEQAVA